MQKENKWMKLRRRSRQLFDKQEANELSDIDIRILNSFKPIINNTRTLFQSKGGGNQLSKDEREYKAVTYAVTQYIKGVKCDVSLDSLVRWFPVHYSWVACRNCIDYNRWNALNTFRNVLKHLNIDEQKLAYLLSKWIFTYEDLGYEDYLNEYLSLSTLKRPWILESLVNDEPVSKSKKSYY